MGLPLSKRIKLARLCRFVPLAWLFAADGTPTQPFVKAFAHELTIGTHNAVSMLTADIPSQIQCLDGMLLWASVVFHAGKLQHQFFSWNWCFATFKSPSNRFVAEQLVSILDTPKQPLAMACNWSFPELGSAEISATLQTSLAAFERPVWSEQFVNVCTRFVSSGVSGRGDWYLFAPPAPVDTEET